jgi:hypothetical protein
MPLAASPSFAIRQNLGNLRTRKSTHPQIAPATAGRQMDADSDQPRSADIRHPRTWLMPQLDDALFNISEASVWD